MKRFPFLTSILLTLALLGIFIFPAKSYGLSLKDELQNSEQIGFKTTKAPTFDSSLAITPYAMTEEVWDTYDVLVGLLNGEPVHGLIIEVRYKRLTFNKTYAQRPSTLISVTPIPDTGHSIDGFGMAFGSIETWRCNYDIS